MGTVVQLKNRINNSYLELKNSVDEKLILVEEKIKKLNIELPTPGEPIANYVPAVRFSETKNSMLVYVSGTGPRKENGDYLTGRLGDDMTIEEGYGAAKLTGINILASLKKEIGDLNKIKRFSAISLFETFASIEASRVSVIILFRFFKILHY